MQFVKSNFVPLLIGVAIGRWVVPMIVNRLGR